MKIDSVNQSKSVQNVNYACEITVQKQTFIGLNKTDIKGKNQLPINYFKLNKDLLMDIIESRQKLLIQRLQFENDFNEIFPHYHDNNTNESHMHYNSHKNTPDLNSKQYGDK